MGKNESAATRAARSARRRGYYLQAKKNERKQAENHKKHCRDKKRVENNKQWNRRVLQRKAKELYVNKLGSVLLVACISQVLEQKQLVCFVCCLLGTKVISPFLCARQSGTHCSVLQLTCISQLSEMNLLQPLYCQSNGCVLLVACVSQVLYVMLVIVVF